MTRTGTDEPLELLRRVAAGHPRCFWLDGGGARDWSGDRSVVGWLDDADVSLTYDARTRIVTRHQDGRAVTVGDDVFDALEAELGRGDPADEWFGYLGYSARPDLPTRLDPSDRPHGAHLPDAVWMRPGHVRVFRQPGGTHDAGVELGHGAAGPVPDQYAAAFARVQEHLHAGNTYETNLTHRLTTGSDVHPVQAYARLRELSPAPYAGFVQHDVVGARGWLLSASPERYARVEIDPAGARTIAAKPIKGTTPRGSAAGEDAALAHRLATGSKYRAENLMIVDLLRNDLASVCEPGSVEVPLLMAVESYAHVHQLVSTVRGRLRADVSTVRALHALFPAGSMTGAPKLRTMQVIAEVESTARGVYAGAFGWVAADGRADLGVVIRSLVTAGDGAWTLGTGGGVTVDSDLAEEYEESCWKAFALLHVLATEQPGQARSR